MPTPSRRSSRGTVFGSVLRRQRVSAGLTQAELAERAGVGERTVSNLERGINASPYPSTVRMLAAALDLSAEARSDLLAAAGRRTSDGRGRWNLTGGYLGAAAPGRLIARDAERAAIDDALTRAANGEGQVVLLAGEPGIGKTRLAQEAGSIATDRGFLVAYGRCFEAQSETPFVPLLEVFATLEELAPARVREGVDRWPSLSTLLPEKGFPEAPPVRSSDAAQLLHRSAVGLVRELSEHRPVGILLDDLHWADDATLELLTNLARHTASSRVFLLGTFRDAEASTAHPVRRLAHSLHRERLSGAIGLNRFDRDATAEMIRSRLDNAPAADELVDLVQRTSEGNPFYAGEVLTALRERGDLERVDDRWVFRGADDVGAPASVNDMIESRVARLSAEARDVLDMASVLGSVFEAEDLAPHGTDVGELESILDEAAATGLVRIGHDGYAFDHSLTQQAFYAALSPLRRQRLHRLVGERLVAAPQPVHRRRASEIARHLEAGGEPDRAIPFVLLAGDVAAEGHAQTEAARLYGHAVDLAEEAKDDGAHAAGIEGLGRVAMTTAKYDLAVEYLTTVADAYARQGDVESRMRVEGMIADSQHRRGEGEVAAARLTEVISELEGGIDSGGPRAGVAALSNGLARVRLSLGQHPLCVEATEVAARVAREVGWAAAEADALSVRGTALLFMDDPEAARSVLERAIAIAGPADALVEESGATLALQWSTTMRGDLDRAQALGERGIAITRRSGNTDAEALHTANLGLALFYRGDWDEAGRLLERGVELARAGSPSLFSGIPPVYLGVLRAGQGDAAAATACYDEASTAPDLQTFAFAGYLAARRAELDLVSGHVESAWARLEPWLGQEAPTRIHDVMLLSTAARASLARGDVDRGEQLVEHALRRAEVTRNEIDGIDAQRLQGRCLETRGRSDEARHCLESARQRATAVPYPAAEARAREDLARLGA